MDPGTVTPAESLAPPAAAGVPFVAFTPGMEAQMQALALFGLGRLARSCHLFGELTDVRGARRWLRRIVPTVTDAGPARGSTATQVALTADGLRILGLTDRELAGFARSFTEGMTTPHRSRILGDQGATDPRTWRWGGPGSPVHAMVALFADTPELLAALVDAHLADMDAAGVRVHRALDTSVAGDSREHFGFVDGLSQPLLRGTPPARRSADERWSLLEPGEFLLGLTDASGRLPASPSLSTSPPGSRACPTRRSLRPSCS